MLRILRLLAFAAAVSPDADAAQSSGRFEGRIVHAASGEPVAGATVSIAGLTGSARTDNDGRFTWTPAPPPPFHIIVVLSTGEVARPAIVETVNDGGNTIELRALSNEAITVLGAAPSISTTPASATTMLSAAQVAQRNPENLMQALETVPGINQVSEGHAAVPAVRGLARGRTLFLIDGGRVTAERRVGPSATFLDPASIEGIDISRGPGSVAYGSDALGGVISVRTRRAEPGSPLRARFSGTIGAGIPEARGSFEVSKGLPRGGVLVQAHARNAEDYTSADGDVFNSGWEDRGVLMNFSHVLGAGLFTAAWQSDYGRDIERPRNNSRTVRFYYPFEDSHRFTTSYQRSNVGGFRQIAFTGFLGGYQQRTDQDRFATSTTGRSIERADVSAKDFHVKGSAERQAGPARLEFGVDVNGRYNLEALDIIQAHDLAGALTRDTTNVSVEDARRIDTGVFLQVETAVGRHTRVSGGVRGDRVTTRNIGGFFGDRSTAHSAASGFGAVSVTPAEHVTFTAQLSRGFRDPVLSDRYFRGPSGRGFITGNPDLQPETSVQLDLAARYTIRQTQVGVFFYNYRITDLVERYQTQTDFFFFRNRGRARLRGLEVETRSELGRGFSFELGTQIARGRALDDNAALDDISPVSLSIVGRKQFTEGIYALARLGVYAKDNRPGPSEIAAPGARLLDAGAGWRVSRHLELRGHLRNLLNEAYYASPDPRFVLAPGRSGSLTVALLY
jgi:outer membrane receptor protein involved in Fe transport